MTGGRPGSFTRSPPLFLKACGVCGGAGGGGGEGEADKKTRFSSKPRIA